ncbi:MAG: hypothetical protein MHPSP_002669, partial [Paramarteilia canceri]
IKEIRKDDNPNEKDQSRDLEPEKIKYLGCYNSMIDVFYYKEPSSGEPFICCIDDNFKMRLFSLSHLVPRKLINLCIIFNSHKCLFGDFSNSKISLSSNYIEKKDNILTHFRINGMLFSQLGCFDGNPNKLMGQEIAPNNIKNIVCLENGDISVLSSNGSVSCWRINK